MVREVGVCFVGGSLVAGMGDEQFLGWAGRLAMRAAGAGRPLTYYNLGVAGQTSADVAARWEAECALRLNPECDARVVFSFGGNDMAREDGRVRVPISDSAANLAGILRRAAARDWTALVVAPPPNDDDEHTGRIGELDAKYSEVCAAQDIPYVRVHQPLLHNHTWRRAVREADGYHPGAAGYEEFAALMVPYWLLWLTEPGAVLPVVR